MKNFITKNRLVSLAGILFLLVVWEVISLLSGSEQIIPPPGKTLVIAGQLFLQEGFWVSVGITVLRGLAGFAISLVLAMLTGIPAGLNRTFFLFINPLLVTIRSTPVISLILLAIIWFGNEKVPVFIAILTMFPIIAANVTEGIKNVDPGLVEMGRTYHVRFLRILKDIYIPSVIPFLTSGISTALGFGWRAIIIGEVLSQPRSGIGTEMQNAQVFLQVGELIAWTIIAIAISYLFELSMRKMETALVKWR